MTYIDTEGMQRAANQAREAASSMQGAASIVEDAVRKLSQYCEQGYGSPLLRLIELLEAIPENEDRKEKERLDFFNNLMKLNFKDKGDEFNYNFVMAAFCASRRI